MVTDENVEKQLEENVVDDLNINFLFNKGGQLTNGLIDDDRLYNIMNKVK